MRNETMGDGCRMFRMSGVASTVGGAVALPGSGWNLELISQLQYALSQPDESGSDAARAGKTSGNKNSTGPRRTSGKVRL